MVDSNKIFLSWLLLLLYLNLLHLSDHTLLRSVQPSTVSYIMFIFFCSQSVLLWKCLLLTKHLVPPCLISGLSCFRLMIQIYSLPHTTEMVQWLLAICLMLDFLIHWSLPPPPPFFFLFVIDCKSQHVTYTMIITETAIVISNNVNWLHPWVCPFLLCQSQHAMLLKLFNDY